MVMTPIQISAGIHCFHAPLGNHVPVDCATSVVDSDKFAAFLLQRVVGRLTGNDDIVDVALA